MRIEHDRLLKNELTDATTPFETGKSMPILHEVSMSSLSDLEPSGYAKRVSEQLTRNNEERETSKVRRPKQGVGFEQYIRVGATRGEPALSR